MERTPNNQYRIPGKQYSEQLERVDHFFDDQLSEIRQSVITENGGHLIEAQSDRDVAFEMLREIQDKGVILTDIRKDPSGWSLAA